MPTPENLWQAASTFAARAHRHQLRRDGETPYMSHPVRVALTVACVFGCMDESVLAAALLHDVIEDTGADYDDLLERFGQEVADLVACLSKDMRVVEDRREIEYDRQLADGPWKARLIKLADVIDNLSDATDSGARRTLLSKVERAVALPCDEPELAAARRIVVERMRAAEADEGSS